MWVYTLTNESLIKVSQHDVTRGLTYMVNSEGRDTYSRRTGCMETIVNHNRLKD